MVTSIKPMALVTFAAFTLQIAATAPASAATGIRLASVPRSAAASPPAPAADTHDGDDTLTVDSLRTAPVPAEALTDGRPPLPARAAPGAGTRHPLDTGLMVLLSIAIVSAQLKRKQRLLEHRLR